MTKQFENKLSGILPSDRILLNEPLKNHTTFRVGGPADVVIIAESIKEVENIVRLCKEEQVDPYVFGNGSNILVSDKGYSGVVIKISKVMSRIEVEEDRVTAEAGALLSQIASRLLQEELTGFEFAAGIPGTLGGGCIMNAGAYGGELKDVIREVTSITRSGEKKTYPAEKLEMGYRTSIFQFNREIVLSAVLKLEKGDPLRIKEQMDELRRRRTEKQPLEFASAGSTFKRPKGYFAGKLIEEAGLRGYRVGDAQVSEKHCGFVINRGNATAAEIWQLMQDVIGRVKENSGITLEPEVRRIGDFQA